MRVLLLGCTGSEPSFLAWRETLSRECVPFEMVVASPDRPPIEVVTEDGAARFQAIVFATNDVPEETLTQQENVLLAQLQLAFGIRKLIAYAYPGPGLGLGAPTYTGELRQVEGRITDAGAAVFPYLKESVPIADGTWGYMAMPVRRGCQTLIEGPGETTLVGIQRRPDGREEMVQMFDGGVEDHHSTLLAHGQLSWLTRGCYFGYQRHYLALHIDDVMGANHAWDPVAHVSDTDAAAAMRMDANDGAAAAAWCRENGLRFDLVCNGIGNDLFEQSHGGEDALLAVLREAGEQFRWLNHTYSHADFASLDEDGIVADIEQNLAWAGRAGISLEPAALVSGGHSGLANVVSDPPEPQNPAFVAALRRCGIQYVACDASREHPVEPGRPGGERWPAGIPFMVEEAMAVPRYPTGLAYDVATREQALDRHICGGGEATTWPELIVAEADRLLGLMLANDPRPHYFHQSNLIRSAGDGILFELIDAVLARHRATFTTEVVQPTLGECGTLLIRQLTWRAAVRAEMVAGRIEKGRVAIVNRAERPVDVPLTGAEVGDPYAGERSGWARVPPGGSAVAVAPTRKT
jgi:hypothetical protein